jgi:hypothetical protein
MKAAEPVIQLRRCEAFGRPKRHEACQLSGRVIRATSGEMVHHAVEIGIAGAKHSGEPVPAALGDLRPVRDDVELAGLSRRHNGINAHALLDQGHETRDLGLVVPSRRAVDYLDLHSVLPSIYVAAEQTTLTGRYRGSSAYPTRRPVL